MRLSVDLEDRYTGYEALAHETSFMRFSKDFQAYFDSKEYNLKQNIYSFITFMLINFLVRTLQCTENQILNLF